MMMNTAEPVRTGPTSAPRVSVPATALLLGALQLLYVLGYGLMLDAPGLAPLGLLAFAPLFAMILVLATATPRAHVPSWTRALVPVAVGLVTVTMLVGTFAVPGSIVWWVVGAVVSAAPLALLARAWPR